MHATERIVRVEVTAEDIRLGQRQDPAGCPVARACCRAFGLLEYAASATVTCVRLPMPGKPGRTRYALPGAATERIIAYDRGGVMRPFAFELDLTKVVR